MLYEELIILTAYVQYKLGGITEEEFNNFKFDLDRTFFKSILFKMHPEFEKENHIRKLAEYQHKFLKGIKITDEEIGNIAYCYLMTELKEFIDVHMIPYIRHQFINEEKIREAHKTFILKK